MPWTSAPLAGSRGLLKTTSTGRQACEVLAVKATLRTRPHDLDYKLSESRQPAFRSLDQVRRAYYAQR